MNRFLILFLIFTSTAYASPLMTVKDRLRINLWVEGLEEKPIKKVKAPVRELPEELERALRKM